MPTPITEVLDFIDYTVNKSFMNSNTAGTRRTACKNLFEILDDEQKTVEYVKDNLDMIVHRLNNKHKDKFTGQTLEAYKSRVKTTLDNYLEWSDDKSNWEKKILSKARSTTKPVKEGQKAERVKREEDDKAGEMYSGNDGASDTKPKTRRLALPIRPGFDVNIEIPADGFTRAELQKLGFFLLPYCNDISSESWKDADWGVVAKS